jgi:hypothetical protein
MSAVWALRGTLYAVLREVLKVTEVLQPWSLLKNSGGAIKPAAPRRGVKHSFSNG